MNSLCYPKPSGGLFSLEKLSAFSIPGKFKVPTEGLIKKWMNIAPLTESLSAIYQFTDTGRDFRFDLATFSKNKAKQSGINIEQLKLLQLQ